MPYVHWTRNAGSLGGRYQILHFLLSHTADPLLGKWIELWASLSSALIKGADKFFCLRYQDQGVGVLVKWSQNSESPRP